MTDEEIRVDEFLDDDEIVDDEEDDKEDEDLWLSDVEGPQLSHEHLGVSVYDRAGASVYHVLLALSGGSRPPAAYADAVADAIDFANAEGERLRAENQRYIGKLFVARGHVQRFTDEAERHAAKAKRHSAKADVHFMEADRFSERYDEDADEVRRQHFADEAERCFCEYLRFAHKEMRRTDEELRCRREALNCRHEEQRCRREALRYDDVSHRWFRAADCLTKIAKRPPEQEGQRSWPEGSVRF